MNERKLNRITREQTAFRNFAEMLDASGRYRPTIELSNRDRCYLASEYDKAQAARGDDRRAHTYMNAAMAETERNNDHEKALLMNKNPWRTGDSIDVYSNQADRIGWVLAVIGDDVLVEYLMPAGTTAMLVYTYRGGRMTCRRNVAYRSCPQKWLNAMRTSRTKWLGFGQRGNVPFPAL